MSTDLIELLRHIDLSGTHMEVYGEGDRLHIGFIRGGGFAEVEVKDGVWTFLEHRHSYYFDVGRVAGIINQKLETNE